MQHEQAKLATATSKTTDGGGRRWPTPAVTKALLGSYEMTVHRFPTFLRCLERKAAGDGDGVGVEEGWETSRMNFGTSGWRLLAEAGAVGEGKKQK